MISVGHVVMVMICVEVLGIVILFILFIPMFILHFEKYFALFVLYRPSLLFCVRLVEDAQTS